MNDRGVDLEYQVHFKNAFFRVLCMHIWIEGMLLENENFPAKKILWTTNSLKKCSSLASPYRSGELVKYTILKVTYLE